jgi:hypothetical protein
MNRLFVVAGAAAGLLSACVSSREPVRTSQSARNREQIVDCLLNRLADPTNRRLRVSRSEHSTQIILDTAIVHTPALNFVVNDAPNGSEIEFRRLSSLTPGRTVAETCF